MRHVGSLLDASAPQPSRSGRNHLLWIARSQRLPVSRVDAVTELVGLGKAARRKAGGYSLGMRQRLGIAAAMLGDPPTLIMDEPFNCMDPEGIIWMRGADGGAVHVPAGQWLRARPSRSPTGQRYARASAASCTSG
jgi:ABC-2 type transport system ATP-binding protein